MAQSVRQAIAIVASDPSLLLKIRLSLVDAGFDIVAEETAEEALAILSRKSPGAHLFAVVASLHNDGGDDGVVVIRHITQARGGGFRRIIIPDGSSLEARIRATTSGMTLLPSPFKPESLLAALAPRREGTGRDPWPLTNGEALSPRRQEVAFYVPPAR